MGAAASMGVVGAYWTVLSVSVPPVSHERVVSNWPGWVKIREVLTPREPLEAYHRKATKASALNVEVVQL